MNDEVNAAMQELGQGVFQATDQIVGQGNWSRSEVTAQMRCGQLDAQLAVDGKQVCPDVSGSNNIVGPLYQIHEAQKSADQEWSALTLTLTSEGEIAIDFRYPKATASEDDEAHWQNVYETRSQFYESEFGPLPDEIHKIGHMAGVWPGGGLFYFESPQQNGAWILSTFGLSNPDMPATTTAEDIDIQHDSEGRPSKTSMRVVAKPSPPMQRMGMAGYGYELLIITPKKQEWPLWVMQWACNAEILSDADLLGRVETFEGLTVEAVQAGEDLAVNVLFAEAQKPLPSGVELPSGHAKFIVITTITDDEMQFCFDESRNALLQELVKGGVGQISDPARQSVLKS